MARKRCGTGQNNENKETRHDKRVEIEMWVGRNKRSMGEKRKTVKDKKIKDKQTDEKEETNRKKDGIRGENGGRNGVREKYKKKQEREENGSK